jgi:transcriptional regulator with GAF, ATPase, and Fis domain
MTAIRTQMAARSWHRPRLVAAAGPHFERHGIVGRSDVFDDVIRRIELVAATRSTVLITGETGTGKELVARAVHACSAEAAMPFVKVNCAAIPDALLESELFGHVRGAFTDATSARKGKFALANGGTILLDEIGVMGSSLQAKLLRVLQEREFEPLGAERVERIDVRVIAATNRDLRRLVQEGRFQEDLYYRLQVVPISVPPLRSRLDDVPLLVRYFIDKHAGRNGWPPPPIDEDALRPLLEHDWPGNVRELENTIERAVVLSAGRAITRSTITIDPVPAAAECRVPFLRMDDNLRWAERETIQQALRSCARKSQAARCMGISARALSYYLAKHPGLDAPRRVDAPDRCFGGTGTDIEAPASVQVS